MADTNAQDESGATAPGQAAVADHDAPMAYIDRLVAAVGVEDVEQDGDEDDEWLEEEYVEDLVESDDDENDAKSDSDDEEMYDSDESDDGVDIEMLCAETTVPREPSQPKELSAEAKLDLTWRLDKDESYSDWTIEIITSSDDEDADEGTSRAFYHVHKNTLATGSRKSEYFDGIFSSDVGRFQESENSTSKILLPPDMAVAFPGFLDYMYAPLSEARCVLSTDNVLQLRSLASYFIVQALTDATRDFIIADMANLDRTEKYLKAAVEREDQELIGHAVQICASSIGGIEADSSLLLAMPPAFFLAVAMCIDHAFLRLPDGISIPEEKQLQIGRLSVSYLQHFGGLIDHQYFCTLKHYLSLLPPSPQSVEINSFATLALDLLKLMRKYGWEVEQRSNIEWWCVEQIDNYLSISNPNYLVLDRFVRSMSGNIPEFATEILLKRGFSTTRHFKRCYDCKKCDKIQSSFALIPCGHMFCSSCADESLEASECPRCNTAVTSTLKLK